MDKFCDLHTHSYFSDGTCSPRELVDRASALGLTHIALCDHNTTAGLAEFIYAARGKDITAVPGVELSTDYGDVELHILALFLSPDSYAEIESAVSEMQRRKDLSNEALIRALTEGGYEISPDEIMSRTNGHINRAHVAAALVKSGYAADIKEAFDRFLRPERGFYTPPKRLPVFETISLIKSTGAAAVLAHPFLSLENEGTVRRFLTEAIPYGLDGMETVYSTYDKKTQRTARLVAEELGILESGGSDFHGENKPDIEIGIGRGNLKVPSDFAEALRQKAR